MTAGAPPRLARWLLGRLASGPRRDSLIGDLEEHFAHGRSSWWYWRQVLLAILAGAVKDLCEHKALAGRAVLISWAILVPWHYVTLSLYRSANPWIGTWISMDRRIASDASQLMEVAWWAWWIYGVPVLAAWFAMSFIAGWSIARLHRGHRASTVFASVAFQVPWALLWAWPAWRLAHVNAGTPYGPPNQIVAMLTLAGIPIFTLLGGLWRADDNPVPSTSLLAGDTVGSD
jgi:hypothetical protein